MRADRIADPWGARTPYGRHEAWPARVDTYLAEGVEPETNTPAEFAAFIRAEVTRWGQAVKAAGLGAN